MTTHTKLFALHGSLPPGLVTFGLIQKSPKDQDPPMQACGTAFWANLAPRLRQILTPKKLLLWRVV